MAKHFTNYKQTARIIDQVTITSANLGVAHLSTEDATLEGRHVTIQNSKLVSFGSCSYLGLEHHKDLKQGAIDAIKQFGTQFSSSRAYLSLGLYKKLETLLEKMFEAPVIVTPSTTLGHLSAIPVLVESNDVVIMDMQVHASVQTVIQLIKGRNIDVEMIRHNRMDHLEERITELKNKHEKIWFMVDGVFSMYGDYAPFEDLLALLIKYEQLHLYVDDAHGMSWAGKNGVGYARSVMPKHERLYMATSLNKAFAAGGGCLIFPNEEIRRKVRNQGSTMIFSGPLQPPLLGSAIASAELHLSDKIYPLQNDLQARISYFHEVAAFLKLPLISSHNSPIKFIGVGKPGVGYSMVRRLMDKGFYVNLSVFPSVSYKNTGLRLPLTNHLTFKDLDDVLELIAKELPKALHEENSNIRFVHEAFKIAV